MTPSYDAAVRLWKAVPEATRILVAANTIISVTSNVCLDVRRPTFVAMTLSTFAHAGVVHFVFNMCALLTIGAELERRLGPKVFGAATGLLIAWCEGLLCLAAAAGLLHGCVLGYSGVLFGYFTVEADMRDEDSTVSICGVVIRARWAPWLLLLLTGLIAPQSSFAGHLIGILGGYAFSRAQSYLRASRGEFSCDHRATPDPLLPSIAIGVEGTHPACDEFKPFLGTGRRLGGGDSA